MAPLSLIWKRGCLGNHNQLLVNRATCTGLTELVPGDSRPMAAQQVSRGPHPAISEGQAKTKQQAQILTHNVNSFMAQKCAWSGDPQWP